MDIFESDPLTEHGEFKLLYRPVVLRTHRCSFLPAKSSSPSRLRKVSQTKRSGVDANGRLQDLRWTVSESNRLSVQYVDVLAPRAGPLGIATSSLFRGITISEDGSDYGTPADTALNIQADLQTFARC